MVSGEEVQTAARPAASAAPIAFLDVSKRYPGRTQAAVADLSFEVPSGEICVLIGPSGCGKTTALKMVNRLIPMTNGDITIDGRSVKAIETAQLRRGIGYVFQQIGLFPHMTVEDNIGTVPRLLGWSKSRIRSGRANYSTWLGSARRTTCAAIRGSSPAASSSASGSFFDTDAIAVTKAYAAKYGLKTTADLKKIPHFTLGARPEFQGRQQGAVGMQKIYGVQNFTFKSLALGLQYQALDSGAVNAADVFTTDPQLASGSTSCSPTPSTSSGSRTWPWSSIPRSSTSSAASSS